MLIELTTKELGEIMPALSLQADAVKNKRGLVVGRSAMLSNIALLSENLRGQFNRQQAYDEANARHPLPIRVRRA